MSNTINTAITNWSSDGRNQLYENKKKTKDLFIYLFFFFSNELYKQFLENDKDKYEAELGNFNFLILFFL